MVDYPNGQLLTAELQIADANPPNVEAISSLEEVKEAVARLQI